jgi:tripeptidyl-peptidase-1
MFTDVTEGSNPYEKCDGFQAAAGWDPVTGMGTPLYPKMLEAAFAALEVKA